MCACRQQHLMVAGRVLEEQKLLELLARPLGFVRGRPVAALLIFRYRAHIAGGGGAHIAGWAGGLHTCCDVVCVGSRCRLVAPMMAAGGFMRRSWLVMQVLRAVAVV